LAALDFVIAIVDATQLSPAACDYLTHCFVEAVRRHDPAKLPWR